MIRKDDALDVGGGPGELGWQADEVVLADGGDLDRVGELVRRVSGVRVGREQLLGSLDSNGGNGRQELAHLDRVVSLSVHEVESVLGLLDTDL